MDDRQGVQWTVPIHMDVHLPTDDYLALIKLLSSADLVVSMGSPSEDHVWVQLSAWSPAGDIESAVCHAVGQLRALLLAAGKYRTVGWPERLDVKKAYAKQREETGEEMRIPEELQFRVSKMKDKK